MLKYSLFTMLTHANTDLEFYSLSNTDVDFAPNPGNQNVQIQKGPDDEAIGFDICGRAMTRLAGFIRALVLNYLAYFISNIKDFRWVLYGFIRLIY